MTMPPVSDRQVAAARDTINMFVEAEGRRDHALQVLKALADERDHLRQVIVRQEQALARLTLTENPHAGGLQDA